MKKILTLVLVLAPTFVNASGAGGHYDWAGLFWRVLTTIIFVVILYKLLKNPVKNFVSKRSAEIEKALQDALQANVEAKARLADYEEKVAKLESELELMKANALKAAEKERETVLADTEKSIEKMKRFALNMIEAETAKAKNELRKELALIAAGDAEKHLAENIKGKKAEELTEQYIKRIGE